MLSAHKSSISSLLNHRRVAYMPPFFWRAQNFWYCDLHTLMPNRSAISEDIRGLLRAYEPRARVSIPKFVRYDEFTSWLGWTSYSSLYRTGLVGRNLLIHKLLISIIEATILHSVILIFAYVFIYLTDQEIR